MKIGNHRIDHFEFVARPDKQAGRVVSCRQLPLCSSGFQNADRGSPDGNNSAAGFFDAIYQFRVCFVDAELFLVYLMLFERFSGYRLKCPLANGKRNIGEFNPLRFKLLNELFSEMQSGCRRCNRAWITCVNRLVSLPVLDGLV